MKFIYLIFLLLVIDAGLSFDIPKHIVPETSDEVQENAVRELIKRAIGEQGAQRFNVTVDQNLNWRSFKLNKSDDGKIVIIGSDGVSVAKAFHHYLKYYLNVDLTWYKSNFELPANKELPNVQLSLTSASSFIYYQNVCTWSYSFVWWNWHDWRRHIDWMAMMGITLTIAPIQEYIWYDVYKDFGLTEDEISQHFAGPAFQAWQRMGNIRGWGGPLPSTYRQKQMELQKQILKAQRDLGMSVALPAFAGHLPIAMKRLYPNENLTSVGIWNRFPHRYCCSIFLDPERSLFHEIAGKFLKKVIEIYGSNHIYFADPFNENLPRSNEINYIKTTSKNIYESMKAVDPKAIWLLQGWMFIRDWEQRMVQAFLTGVPQGNILVLDLHSETFPQYEITHSYYGQPFIWCMLHNFGGTLGMHGSAEVVNTRIKKARSMTNSTMIGVGITPEGINQNYVMYSLTMERAWLENDFDLPNWFSYYSDVTYGVENDKLHEAWNLLLRSVYSYYAPISLHGKYTITRRPSLNLKPWIWYNITDIQNAFSLFLDAHDYIPLTNYEAYTLQLVDIGRQFLQVTAEQLYINLISSYNKNNLERFIFIAKQMNILFEDLEILLASNKNFLLGPWLEAAKSMAETSIERELFEMNARNQITSWGPNGQILDYATKQWSGIVRDFYHPRWQLFLEMLEKSLREHKPFNNKIFKRLISEEIENPFSIKRKLYPINPKGDSYEIAKQIYDKWTEKLTNSTYIHYCRLTINYIKYYNSNNNILKDLN